MAMYSDKKVLYTVSSVTMVILLSTLFLPANVGRVAAAIIMIPIAAATCFLLKKRNLPSINKNTILMLMSIMGVFYVMFYYLSGLAFGFRKTGFPVGADTLFGHILPAAFIIICSEFIRYAILGHDNKLASIFTYVSCVAVETVTFTTLLGINTFGMFMDMIGLNLFPAIIANLLYVTPCCINSKKSVVTTRKNFFDIHIFALSFI